MSTTTSRPFFSVVIPTKNRSQLIARAVDSVRAQTFADWEVVVIDNDDTSATSEILARYTDSRIRIFRTGGLTMPDNWEFGFSQAGGSWILLLEDKSLLKPRALAKIHEALGRNPAQVVSWPQDMFNDLRNPPVVSRGPRTQDERIYSAEEVLQMSMTITRGVLETVLPRGLNSCVSRDLLETIRGNAGKVCPPISPDYTIAFLQLAFTDRVLNIQDCLTVYGSCYHSFGRKFVMREADKDAGKNFGIADEDIVRNVPFKIPLTCTGMFNDFEEMKKLVGGRLLGFSIDPVHFWLECRVDIQFASSLGVDMQREMRAWREAVTRQPLAVRREVLRLTRDRGSWTRLLRSVGRALWLQPAWHALKRAFGWRPPIGAEQVSSLPPFLSPDDYVRWEARA